MEHHARHRRNVRSLIPSLSAAATLVSSHRCCRPYRAPQIASASPSTARSPVSQVPHPEGSPSTGHFMCDKTGQMRGYLQGVGWKTRHAKIRHLGLEHDC